MIVLGLIKNMSTGTGHQVEMVATLPTTCLHDYILGINYGFLGIVTKVI